MLYDIRNMRLQAVKVGKDAAVQMQVSSTNYTIHLISINFEQFIYRQSENLPIFNSFPRSQFCQQQKISPMQ